MTEREVIDAFCKLMGFEPGSTSDPSVVLYGNDPMKEDQGRTYLQGYDEIAIAAQFDDAGTMIRGTVYSHVATHGPDWVNTLLDGKPVKIVSTEKRAVDLLSAWGGRALLANGDWVTVDVIDRDQDRDGCFNVRFENGPVEWQDYRRDGELFWPLSYDDPRHRLRIVQFDPDPELLREQGGEGGV